MSSHQTLGIYASRRLVGAGPGGIAQRRRRSIGVVSLSVELLGQPSSHSSLSWGHCDRLQRRRGRTRVPGATGKKQSYAGKKEGKLQRTDCVGQIPHERHNAKFPAEKYVTPLTKIVSPIFLAFVFLTSVV